MTDLVRREADFLLYQTEDGGTRVASKPNMGLTSWTGPVPRKGDAIIAKNYLAEKELSVDLVMVMVLLHSSGQVNPARTVLGVFGVAAAVSAPDVDHQRLRGSAPRKRSSSVASMAHQRRDLDPPPAPPPPRARCPVAAAASPPPQA